MAQEVQARNRIMRRPADLTIENDLACTFASRRISISDIRDVVDYMRETPCVVDVKVWRLLGDGKGAEIADLTDVAGPSLRHFRIEGYMQHGTSGVNLVEVFYIDLGRDTTARAGRHAAGHGHTDTGNLEEEEAAQLLQRVHGASRMLIDRGWRPPGHAVVWLLAMTSIVLAAIGLLVWAILLMALSLQFEPRVTVQVSAIMTLVLVGVAVPLLLLLKRRRWVALQQTGRIRVTARTRSTLRILRENALVAIIVAAVTAAVTTWITLT